MISDMKMENDKIASGLIIFHNPSLVIINFLLSEMIFPMVSSYPNPI